MAADSDKYQDVSLVIKSRPYLRCPYLRVSSQQKHGGSYAYLETFLSYLSRYQRNRVLLLGPFHLTCSDVRGIELFYWVPSTLPVQMSEG